MNLHDDPGAMFRTVLPDTSPPPPDLDLDQIVREGYRARRRHRAVIGGAATTGVAAVAAVLALTVVGLPGGSPDPADDPTGGANPPAAEEAVVEDPTTAGYPYREDWGQGPSGDAEMGAFEPGDELVSVKEAATAAFGPLLADGGAWDDLANTAPEEDCTWLNEDGTEAGAAEFEQCMAAQSGMPVGADQTEGNYGQTYLRSYGGREVEELEARLRTIFEFRVMLPGGWTADPGPITQQVFPQHLISDGPYFTEQAPEFTTEELDDGRTLMSADHGCAAEVAVVYPNGTGLRATWNNCEGEDYPFELGALIDAALAMPELAFDTSELAPVGDLNEVPMGWVYDEGAWESSEEAQASAAETFEAASGALEQAFPGATLSEGSAVSLGLMERGANSQRSYSASGTLPIETTIDTSTGDVNFDLRYYLPGGWIPGFSETGHWDGHLTVCKEGYECSTSLDGDGGMWAFESKSETYEPGPEEDWEASTSHDMYVTYYSPDGWAVGIWTQWTDDAAIDADVLGDVLRAMPAPVYNADERPEIPAG